MTTVTLKGKAVKLSGNMPKPQNKAPEFHLVRGDLSDATLETFKNKKKVISVFPSVDTPTCAKALKTFYGKLKSRDDVVLLNVSKDLPFAQGRFCAAEGIPNAEVLSAFRSSFAKDYGIEIGEGPLQGLCARAVFLLDADNKVIYAELVPEVTQEPDYEALLAHLN